MPELFSRGLQIPAWLALSALAFLTALTARRRIRRALLPLLSPLLLLSSCVRELPVVEDEEPAATVDTPAAPTKDESSAALTTYRYDEASRLLAAETKPTEGPTRSYQYTYDPASNVTAITANGKTQSREHTKTNAISGAPYDENGNPLAHDDTTYSWDTRDRLIGVKHGNHETVFSYDGLSRIVRITDKEKGETVADHAYTWCGDQRCLEHDNLKPDSPITKRYLAQGFLAGNARYYAITDQQGSVRQLLDDKGQTQAHYDYDPYGVLIESTGEAKSDIGYAGYFQHLPTKLSLALYRAYDPTQARWLNRDPIGEAGGLNLYSYVGGLPVNRIDPDGTNPILLAIYACASNPVCVEVAVVAGLTVAAVLGNQNAQQALEAMTPLAMADVAAARACAGASRTGVLEGANFAQKTFGRMFSEGGAFAGKSVEEVAAALRSGAMQASDVPIDYIVRDGNTLILNTRSANALEAAGIPRAAWNAVNRTGQEMFESMLTGQLQRNGLTSAGITTVRQSGR
jgi:RHS repeat-associated protein